MKKIIWIEDDTEIIDLVVRPLERSNYYVQRFYTVSDALEHVDMIAQSDLLLLDLIIPPGGTQRELGLYPGSKLLQILREENHIDVPVIVLSVVADEDLFDDLKKRGARILNKPILPSKLKAEVEEILG